MKISTTIEIRITDEDLIKLPKNKHIAKEMANEIRRLLKEEFNINDYKVKGLGSGYNPGVKIITNNSEIIKYFYEVIYIHIRLMVGC